SHLAQLRELVASMRAGERPRSSGADGRTSLELITALYKSAFTDTTVRAGDIGLGDPYYTALHGGAPGWAPVVTEASATAPSQGGPAGPPPCAPRPRAATAAGSPTRPPASSCSATSTGPRRPGRPPSRISIRSGPWPATSSRTTGRTTTAGTRACS